MTDQVQSQLYCLRGVQMGKSFRYDSGDDDIRVTYIFDLADYRDLRMLEAQINLLLQSAKYPLHNYSTPLRENKLLVKVPRKEPLPLLDHGIVRDSSVLFPGHVVDIKLDLILSDFKLPGRDPLSVVLAVARGFKLVGGVPTGLEGL